MRHFRVTYIVPNDEEEVLRERVYFADNVCQVVQMHLICLGLVDENVDVINPRITPEPVKFIIEETVKVKSGITCFWQKLEGGEKPMLYLEVAPVE